MSSKQLVDDFINQKNIAVVGVSRKKSKFGNYIYRELKKKDYHVFPVNPNLEFAEGDKCYPDLFSVPGKLDGVIINVSPPEAINVLKDVSAAGIQRVWLQQGSQSDDAVKFCEENNIDCVSNECIIMFTEPLGFMHRTHKWIWNLMGKLPQ
jgi:predicted CoA-binding protein